MSDIQLILTGGTLSMHKIMHEDGRVYLVPSGESLDHLAQKIGFETSVKPYIIDSINFDRGEHYPKLRGAVLEALEAGKTPVICGGTDSLVWYSSLLTQDMIRHGYLQPDSNQKIIFLSSMKSIEEAPQLVEGILRAGKLLAEQPITGGFALSAEDMEGERFAVHNVLKHFDKISANLLTALRSEEPVGHITGNTFQPCEAYKQPATPSPTPERHYARIAPPLLRGHDSEMVLAYMRDIGMAKTPFDGMLIEGPPPPDDNQTQLVKTVQWLTKQGTRVVFCNPIRYDNKTRTMHPVIPAETWNNGDNSFYQELKGAGAEFVTGIPKDVYVSMVLNSPSDEANKHTRISPPGPFSKKNQTVLGIRYVPDLIIMEDTIGALAPKTNNIILSALPGKALPDAMGPILTRNNSHHTQYHVAFEYDNNRYIDFNGKEVIERHDAEDSLYEAGQKTGRITHPFSSRHPVREARRRSGVFSTTTGAAR